METGPFNHNSLHTGAFRLAIGHDIWNKQRCHRLPYSSLGLCYLVAGWDPVHWVTLGDLASKAHPHGGFRTQRLVSRPCGTRMP